MVWYGMVGKGDECKVMRALYSTPPSTIQKYSRPNHVVTAVHGPLERSINMAMLSGSEVGLDSTFLNPRRAGEHAAAKNVNASHPTFK